jgi:hypothetical protein
VRPTCWPLGPLYDFYAPRLIKRVDQTCRKGPANPSGTAHTSAPPLSHRTIWGTPERHHARMIFRKALPSQPSRSQTTLTCTRHTGECLVSHRYPFVSSQQNWLTHFRMWIDTCTRTMRAVKVEILEPAFFHWSTKTPQTSMVSTGVFHPTRQPDIVHPPGVLPLSASS